MHADFSLKTLVNNFHLLHIDVPHLARAAQPGHTIVIDDLFCCYIMGCSQGLEMIASRALVDHLREKKQLKVSTLQGTVPVAPDKAKTYLLLGKNEGINATIFYLKQYRKAFRGLVLLASDPLFPFVPCPSRLLTPMLPPNVIAALPLFEDWGIASRLASLNEAPGVYHGTVEALAEQWLSKVPQPVEKIEFKLPLALY